MGGVGGDVNVHVPCVHTWMLRCCYVTGHGWGGRGDVNVHVPCVHTWMTVKQKIQGHSCMHPSVPQYMYMWAWRQSLGNVSPNEFLEHLEDLLPQDWCYKIKKKEANPWKDQLVTSFPKTLKIIVSLRRKHHFANFPMEFSHKKGIHPRFDKSSQNAVKINVRSYSILILTHGRLCAGFLVSLNMFQFIQNKESFEGSSSQPWIN